VAACDLHAGRSGSLFARANRARWSLNRVLRAIAVVVTGLLLALTLSAAGEVWVTTEGLVPAPGASADACSADAFAGALRAQRPGIAVHPWRPESADERPPAGAIQAKLTQRAGVVTLVVGGSGVALLRTLPPSDPCARNVVTSALIVDGALDVLRVPTKAPLVDSLAPPIPFLKQLHVTAEVGAGVAQGMFAVVPAFALGGSVRYRSFELTLAVDLGLASQTTFTILPPEATRAGTFSAITGSSDLGVGAAPRIGPGHLAAGVGFGLSFTSASASSTGLFQQRTESAIEPFGALKLGYALDLPHGLVVALRAEKRINRTASFAIDGAQFAPPSGQGTVTTPLWTFQALAFLGLHFS
jgi:hypothetical protein